MKDEGELVSIILPVYNAEMYVGKAIESCLMQDYENIELIIINDSSTDNSHKVISKYLDDKRIVYVENKKNLQLIKSLNKGIQLANGNYIARMDADDICEVSRLTKQVRYLQCNSDTVLVGCNYRVFGSKERIVKNPLTDSECRAALFTASPFCHPSVVFRRKVVIDNKLEYSSDYLHAEDYKFFIELSKLGKVANIRDILLNYRYHSEQISQKNSIVQFECRKKIITESLDDSEQPFMVKLLRISKTLSRQDRKFFFKGYLELLLNDPYSINLNSYFTILLQSRTVDFFKFTFKILRMNIEKGRFNEP